MADYVHLPEIKLPEIQIIVERAGRAFVADKFQAGGFFRLPESTDAGNSANTANRPEAEKAEENQSATQNRSSGTAVLEGSTLAYPNAFLDYNGWQSGGQALYNEQLSEHLPITAGQRYSLLTMADGELASTIFWYDAEQKPIFRAGHSAGPNMGMIDATTFVDGFSAVAPANAVYARVFYRKHTNGKLWFGLTENIPDEWNEVLTKVVELNRNNHPIRFTAHRGAESSAPEETEFAFRRALELGFSVLEADIRKTSDGQYVLLHDETLDRTARVFDAEGNLIGGRPSEIPNGTEVYDRHGVKFESAEAVRKLATAKIDTLTFAEADRFDYSITLEKYHLGGSKANPIVKLSSFIDFCRRHNATARIELRSELEQADLRAIHAITTEGGMEKQVEYASFDLGLLSQISTLSPSAALTLPVGSVPDDALIKNFAQLKTPTNKLWLSASKTIINWDDAVNKILEANNIALEVWTLTKKSEYDAVKNAYVSGIISADSFQPSQLSFGK